MTDGEWAALEAVLRGGPEATRRGRPPGDLRRLWDGIFHVACGRAAWREMPEAFGRPDTAHRALRRAAAARRLHAMLLLVSDDPVARDSPLRGIEWFVVRAFRRAFRIAPHAIAFARRLGLADALPALPCWLPKPDLSEALKPIADKAVKSPGGAPLPLLRALHALFVSAAGRPRMWRTTG